MKFYADAFDNLDDMNKFLEKHTLPKLAEGEIKNLRDTIYK